MSKTMSLRLRDDQLARLESIRQRLNQRSISAAMNILLEEKLREEKYRHITFRDSQRGRQAFVAGAGLAVWEVIFILQGYDGDAKKTAEHLAIPAYLVEAAMRYHADYPDEVDPIVDEVYSITYEDLKRRIPTLRQTTVDIDLEIEPPAARAL